MKVTEQLTEKVKHGSVTISVSPARALLIKSRTSCAGPSALFCRPPAPNDW